MVWWILGWTVSLAGLVLALWALMRDRSRGRRRCPKCWYDMRGTAGMRCPECGRDAKNEKHFFRTRRRWGWVLAAAVLIALGPMIGFGINAAIHGVWGAMPNAGLVAAYPWLDQLGGAVLHSRFGNGELREWESRWLLARCRSGINHSENAKRLQRDLVFYSWFLRMARDGPRGTPWGRWPSPQEISDFSTTERLFDLAADPDLGVGPWVSVALTWTPDLLPHLPRWFQAASVAPTTSMRSVENMIALLHGPNATGYMTLFSDRSCWSLFRQPIDIDAPGVRELLQQLADTQLYAPEFEQAIEAALRGEDPLLRRVALRSLAIVRRGETAARDRLLRLVNDPDCDVRIDLVGVITAFPPSDGTIELIARAFQDDPLSDVPVVAAGELGPAGLRFQPQLLSGLMTCHTCDLWAFGRAYREIGGEKPPLCIVVEKLALDASLRMPGEDAARIGALVDAGAECPEMIGHIEVLLRDRSEPLARVLATQLYVNSGGEVWRAIGTIHGVLSDPSLTYQSDYTSRPLRHFLASGRLRPIELRPWLSDPSPAVRRAAIEILDTDPLAAVPLLDDIDALIDDPDPNVANLASYLHHLISWYRDHPDAPKPRDRRR